MYQVQVQVLAEGKGGGESSGLFLVPQLAQAGSVLLAVDERLA